MNDLWKFITEKFEILDIEKFDEEVFITLFSQKHKEVLELELEIFVDHQLEIGDVLSRLEINNLKKEQKIKEAYHAALKRISMRDYSEFEMRGYLKSRFDLLLEEEDWVIGELIEKRFIDDQRYLADRIDYLRNKNRGNFRIVEDLKKRGFSEEKILSYLDLEDQETYIERGIERAEAFIKTQKAGSKKQRENKLKQHLYRQGFDFESIDIIINEMMDYYSDEDELESLRQMLEKSQSRLKNRYDGAELRNRLVRQALGKGYNYDMISEVLKELENES